MSTQNEIIQKLLQEEIKTTRQTRAVGEGLLSGLTLGLIKPEPTLREEHPVATGLAEVAGSLVTFPFVWKNLKVLNLVSKLPVLRHSPTVATWTSRALRMGTATGIAGTISAIGTALQEDKALAPEAIKGFAREFGPGLLWGGLLYIPHTPLRIATSALYGGATAKLRGGTPLDVSLNTLFSGGTAALLSPSITREYKLKIGDEYLNRLSQVLGREYYQQYLKQEYKPYDIRSEEEAIRFIRAFFDRQAMKIARAPTVAEAYTKIFLNPKYSISWLDKQARILSRFLSRQTRNIPTETVENVRTVVPDLPTVADDEARYQTTLQRMWSETPVAKKRALYKVPAHIPDAQVDDWINRLLEIPLHPLEETRALMAELMRKPPTIKPPKPKKPLTLIQEIIQKGGIKITPDIKVELKEITKVTGPGIFRKAGVEVNALMDALKEEGWFPPEDTWQDLKQALTRGYGKLTKEQLLEKLSEQEWNEELLNSALTRLRSIRTPEELSRWKLVWKDHPFILNNPEIKEEIKFLQQSFRKDKQKEVSIKKKLPPSAKGQIDAILRSNDLEQLRLLSQSADPKVSEAAKLRLHRIQGILTPEEIKRVAAGVTHKLVTKFPVLNNAADMDFIQTALFDDLLMYQNKLLQEAVAPARKVAKISSQVKGQAWHLALNLINRTPDLKEKLSPQKLSLEQTFYPKIEETEVPGEEIILEEKLEDTEALKEIRRSTDIEGALERLEQIAAYNGIPEKERAVIKEFLRNPNIKEIKAKFNLSDEELEKIRNSIAQHMKKATSLASEIEDVLKDIGHYFTGGLAYPYLKEQAHSHLRDLMDYLKTIGVPRAKALSLEILGQPYYLAELFPEFKAVYKPVENSFELGEKDEMEIIRSTQDPVTGKEAQVRPEVEKRFIEGIIQWMKAGNDYLTDEQLKGLGFGPEIAAYNALKINAQKAGDHLIKLFEYKYIRPGMSEEEIVAIKDKINKFVKRLPGYLSLMRPIRENPYVLCAIKPTPEMMALETLPSMADMRRAVPHSNKWFEVFPTLAEAENAATQLQKEGWAVDFIGHYANMKRSYHQYLPYFNYTQLMELVEELGIPETAEIEALERALLEKAQLPHLTRRRYIKGEPHTYQALLEAQVYARRLARNRYLRYLARAEATKAINQITDPILRDYSIQWLENVYAADRYQLGFLKSSIYLWHLGRPGFFFQNITQHFFADAKVAGDIGGARLLSLKPKVYNMALKYYQATLKRANAPEKIVGFPQELTDILKELYDRGTLGTQYTKFLMGQALLNKNKFQTFGSLRSALTFFQRCSESVNRSYSAILGYQAGKIKGLSGDALFNYINDVVKETQMVYGPHNTPLMITKLRGIAGEMPRLWWMYKSFGWNVWNWTAVNFAKGRYKTIFYFLGLIGLLSGLTGLAGWQTLRWLIMTITGKDIERDLREAIPNTKAVDFILKGAPALMGVDMSRQLGIADLPPVSIVLGLPLSVFGRIEGLKAPEYTQPKWVLDSLLNDVVMALRYFRQGDYWRGFEELTPLAISQLMQGIRWAREGYRKGISGELLTDTNFMEESLRMIGFYPVRISRYYAKEESYHWERQYVLAKKHYFVQRVAKALYTNNPTLLNQIYLQWRDYYQKAEPQQRFSWSEVMESARFKLHKWRGIQETPTSVPVRMRPTYHRLEEVWGVR